MEAMRKDSTLKVSMEVFILPPSSVFVNLNKKGDYQKKNLRMRKCEPSDLKAITAAVTPGVAIDFFASLPLPLALPLFHTQSFSHALAISMQEWACGSPSYLGSRTPKSQTNKQHR